MSLTDIKQRIALAVERNQRDPKDVTLIAGSKVQRWRWMVAGVLAYGVFWLVT